MTRFAYFGGEIVPIEQAQVSIMTHAFNYGTAVFEGIRAYWNPARQQLYVFRLPEHYERFRRSMRIMHMTLALDAADMAGITVELLRREGFQQDVYVRPLAYKTDPLIGCRLHGLHDDFTCFVTEMGKYIENEEGASACISSWRRNDDNAIPARCKVTGAYVNSALIKSEAVMSGFDEAIVLNQDGHVSEGSAENFFMVRNGQLITPPVTDNILEGITRDTVMALAREELGMETVQRSIDRSEVYQADEAFLTGTGAQVATIISVDHRPVGTGRTGPVTAQLRDLYFKVVRGEAPKYMRWCTPVYGQ